MINAENLIFKKLCRLSLKKPLRKALIYPIFARIAIFLGYIAVCFAASKWLLKIIANKN